MWYERYQPRKKTLTCKYVTHNELISYNREKFRVCTKVKLVPTIKIFLLMKTIFRVFYESL
jgi:hypothetical protein